MPPAFLGAFDAEKIAFVPYNEIQDVFYINDFNWNVTPSNYETKKFKLLLEKVKNSIDEKTWQTFLVKKYYVWDCAAGTGNLIAGLTNKDHIYASTLWTNKM